MGIVCGQFMQINMFHQVWCEVSSVCAVTGAHIKVVPLFRWSQATECLATIAQLLTESMVVEKLQTLDSSRKTSKERPQHLLNYVWVEMGTTMHDFLSDRSLELIQKILNL